ncbi:MAG: 2-phospho-L-lactate guanylyltransferase [Gammaproteobacteria bacterium]|nr:2-phospho-L-lactate guanylyltransferase [Gammaproteobacteria bacterium]
MSLPGGDNSTSRQAIWAIVPIKSFDAAKKRLAGMLSATERRALMLAMARDVLTALSKSSRLAGVLIVSRSPEADALAESFGAARFAESHSTNLPGALEEAAAHAVACHGAGGIFVIPADVPLISADEIDELIEMHRGVTLLPDGEKVGTNGLICSPPDVIELVFDGRSFEPHRRRAIDAGIEPAVVTGSGFVLDVDRPRDLARLLRLSQDSQTASFLQRSGIAERLHARIDPDAPDAPDAPDKQST